MPSRRNLLGAALGTALVTAGCSSKPSTTSNTKAPDKVTHVTGFGVSGSEAFSYVAVAKGYFRDAGIDVTIVPGAAGEQNLATVGSGKAQFTEIDYSGALVRAGNGQFESFRCVAALHTQTLICFIAMGGKGISGPQDLAHRTIAEQAGSVHKLLFPAYAKLAGFDATTVKWVDGTPQTLPAMLATGSADAIGQYVTSEPVDRAAAKGREVTVLPFGTYLTDLYGSALITTTHMLQTNPDLVRRFTGAILKGMQYIVNNPEESARLLKQAVPSQDPTVATAAIKTLQSYVGPGQNGVPYGAFDQGKVARGIALLQGLGLYPNGFAPDRVVDLSIVPGAKAQ